ncbi:acyl carrier protein [Caenimonas sedimenti]|uniref:Acyl carrier protein n=1 Tax=Caenimonas sedimenti TaxID=2596921 RepID=A0A562ZHP5_9BURK|nr:acyl carrier protein [Caenimonas sedimenti]TWO67897.1 acyl carrier protein [Caenimonas sedimenti]
MNEKLRQVFATALALEPAQVGDSLKYAESPAWDSVAHMALVAAIEEAFGIMIDAEDVIDMSSFAEAKRIVAKYL